MATPKTKTKKPSTSLVGGRPDDRKPKKATSSKNKSTTTTEDLVGGRPDDRKPN